MFTTAAAVAAAVIAVPLLSAVPASAINGGHDAAQAYGFLGSLRRLESPRDDLHVCGVSLLTPTIALTAAHCTRSGADVLDRPTSGHPKSWKVRFGSTQIASGGQLVDVQQFTQLNNRYFVNDLALLKLAEPVTGPTIPIATEAPKPGDDVRILGWGMTCDEFTDACLPKHLQEADTKVQRQQIWTRRQSPSRFTATGSLRRQGREVSELVESAMTLRVLPFVGIAGV